MTTIIAIVVAVVVFLATRYWYKKKLATLTVEMNADVQDARTTFYHHGWRDADSFRNDERVFNEMKSAINA